MADSESFPTRQLPMFPLGSVLLPGMALPLRVFEPRYRVLVDTVLLADEPEFGCVLIERGSEVGGGDVRTSVGCIARIVELTRHDDGTITLLAVGTRRIEVVEWLTDDPFPRALVADLPDLPDSPDDPAERAGPDGAAARGVALDRTLTAVLGLLDAGRALGPAPTLDPADLSDDDELRVYQLATVSPLGAHDRLRVLRAPGLDARIALLEELVEEQQLLISARIEFGGH